MQSRVFHTIVLFHLLFLEVTADCYRDNDWNIAFVNNHTFWAAITDDGHETLLTGASCLVQETQQCNLCSAIAASKVVFPNYLLPCLVRFQPTSNLLLANISKVVRGSGEQDDAWKTTMYLDPPRKIFSIRCPSS